MQNEEPQTAGDEISLKDIADFLKCNYKSIVICGIVGLLISLAYVILAPKQYETTWQMQMAQFSNSNSNSNSNSISNIEDPVTLVERLRLPTTYPVEVQRECGMPEDGEFGDYLGGKLEIKPTKDVPMVVDMKLRTARPEQAKQCAEAIVTMVKAQQRSLIEERHAGRQEQLVKYQQSLAEEQRQLEKIKKSEIGNFGYLARLDKLSWLRTRIDTLQEEALLSQMHPAKLIAPIYAPNKPIPRKGRQALLLGILLGLMLGVLYALGREVWRKAV